jgi:hypothetical protein
MEEVFSDLKNIKKELGVNSGIVTNGYWASSVADAVLWLRPLLDLGISDISISNDLFHYGENQENLAQNALEAVKNLNLPGDSICIEKPSIINKKNQIRKKGTLS